MGVRPFSAEAVTKMEDEKEEGVGGGRSRYDGMYRPQSTPEELIGIEISRFTSLPYRIWPSSPESKRFLELIKTLLLKINHLQSISIDDDRPRRQSLDELENVVLKKAMTRLEEEFGNLLNDQVTHPTVQEASTGSSTAAIPVAQPIKDYDIVITPFSNANINSLREIAWAMAAAGYGQKCANAYSIARREFVMESMSRLGITKSNTIENIRAAKFVFLVLFPSEKKLSERVFSGLPALSDLGFADTCRDSAVYILRYAATVATQENSTERLFTVLETYEALRDVNPQIESLFSDDYCSYLVEEFRLCQNKLATTARDVFVLLENSIYRDPAAGSLPETGGVHPLTSYVINYLDLASKSWRTLEEIMSDGPNPATPPVLDQPNSSSSFSIQIGWIMGRLNENLETKSKSYTNDALGYIFLINNGQYIVDRLGQSILARVIGQDWIRGQVGKIRELIALYLTKSWSKVMAVVQVSNDGGRFVGSLGLLKQKINYFNTYLEEICVEQGGWVVASELLKKEITDSIIGVVGVEYRNLLESAWREWKKEMGRLVRYQPEDVESMIVGLFEVVSRTKTRPT